MAAEKIEGPAYLTNSCIVSDHINDGAVLARHLGSGVIATASIAAGAVGATEIANTCIGNAHISATAAIATSKMLHRYRAVYAQIAGDVVAITIPIHLVLGTTGTLRAVKAGTIAACSGNATITVDLKKNGTSVLTAVITLDNANTARVVEAAAITTAGAVAGDFYEVVIAVDAGTGGLGTGLLVEMEIDETPS